MMGREGKTDPFASLTPEERQEFGEAGDWDLIGFVEARPRPGEMGQFSLRVPKSDLQALRDLAEQRGVRFSVVVRDAIENYVGTTTAPAVAHTVVRIWVKSIGGVYTRPPMQADRQTYAQGPTRFSLSTGVAATA